MKELTQKQQEILNFIANYVADHSFPPTIREIAAYFSVSVKGAYDHISALKKKGYIKYQSKQSRTMELIDVAKIISNKELVNVPILGVIAAGQPCLSEENYDGFITLHISMLKKTKDYFAFIVRGDSMCYAGILEGDTAIVEKETNVRNGELVVVNLEDKVMLKRFYKENGQTRLQAENPDYPPIYSDDDVPILGRLAAVIRSY